MQPTGDHQVQNEPQIIFGSNANSFAKPPQLENFLTFYRGYWRCCGAKEERRI